MEVGGLLHKRGVAWMNSASSGWGSASGGTLFPYRNEQSYCTIKIYLMLRIIKLQTLRIQC